MEVLGPPVVRKSVLVHDPFDVEAFEAILGRAPGLHLLLEESDYSGALDLAFDLFCSFYKYFAALLPEDRLPEDVGHRVGLMTRALDLREHRKLRTLTRLQPLESVLATELVLEGLLEEFAAGREGDSESSEEEPAEAPESGEEAAEDAPLELATHRIREILREAEEELRGPAELIATWSEGPGEERRLPTEAKVRFMRELVRNPRLRRITRLFGRYRRLALRQRELRAIATTPEVVDVVQGGDAARALPAEFADLSLPEREDIFYAKVVTQSLLMYQLERREEERPPLYLCLDTSGSMSGEREIWAKAVSLAMTHLALAQRQRVDVVHFGDAADPLHVVSFRPEDDGTTRLAKVEDVASYFLGGGTDFVKPLSHVLDDLEAGDHGRSEILFVSDGQCPISEDFARRFLEMKRRHEVRLTSVLIEGEAASLGRLSDEVHHLGEVLKGGEEVVAGLAASLWQGIPGAAPRKATRGEPLRFDPFSEEG